MRILFVNFSEFWGGGEKWHLSNAELLSQKGHKTFFLLNKNSELEKKVKNFSLFKSLKITNLSFLNPIKLFLIYSYIKKIKADVVIANGPRELKCASFMAKFLNVKKNIYRRGVSKPIRKNLLNSFLLKKCVNLIIANSIYTKISMQKYYPDLDIKVIYNGIETKSLPLNLNKEKKNVAIVARLSKVKGIDLALKILKIVLEKETKIKLIIMGDGEEKENLIKLSNDLKIADNVIFQGFVENVDDYLADAFLFFLPSVKDEGFGFVFIEAMRAKLPCIAFSDSPASEIIINNETGFLIDNFDLNLCAQKIYYLFKNQKDAKEMGEKGYLRFIENFSIKKTNDEFEEIINC